MKDCGNGPPGQSTNSLPSCSESPGRPSQPQGENMFWDHVDVCRSKATHRCEEGERATAFIADSIRMLPTTKLQNLWKSHAIGVLKMLMDHPQSLKVA